MVDLDIRKIVIYMEICETPEQVAQSRCGCPICGNIQGQIEQGSE